MNRLHLLDLPADRMEGEVVAAFFFEDERPVRGPAALLDWRLNGLLTRLLLEGSALGSPDERILALGNGKLGAPWVLFAGAGRWCSLDRETYAGLIGALVEACRLAQFGRVALCVAPLEGMEIDEMEKIIADALPGAGGPEVLVSLVPRESDRFLPRA